MNAEEITDAELIEDDMSLELERYEAQRPAPSLFRTDNPIEVVQKATEVASALKRVVVAQGLATRIQGSDHLRVEAWTTLGSMLGVFPVKEWVRAIVWPEPPPGRLSQMRDQGRSFGFEASFLAQTTQGVVVGGGESECRRTESKWASRDDYALRSMAQTRATSKALKGPLSFIVALAGYSPTPAEEMGASARFSVRRTATGPDLQAEADELAAQVVALSRDREKALELVERKRGELSLGEFRAWLGAQIEKARP